MDKILVVEDDTGLNHGIVLSLKQEDYQFTQAFTIAEAREQLEKSEFDLILLDVNLPDGNGFDLCREIRKSMSVPIIFLTANDMEFDVVTGFELGADDYITKPFSLMILRARVAALLRRNGRDKLVEQIEIGEYTFDFSAMEYKKADQPIELSKTEQKLLKLFVTNKGQVLPRATLVDRIWTDGAEYVDENALSVTVKRLRTKLEDDTYIQTVYGVGYIWNK